MPNLRARQMRKHPTEAESLLWQHLRRSQILGRKFRRQEPMGPYIVDFLCFDPMLVIEIDGSQHTGVIAYDAERSSFLERRGFKVIRFWNHEVLAQTDRVREAIRPPPNPLPSGGGITGHRLSEVGMTGHLPHQKAQSPPHRALRGERWGKGSDLARQKRQSPPPIGKGLGGG